MENIVRKYLEQFRRDHTRQRRYACMLGVLALLVCLAVFWRLKLTGTAMTNEASCGLQEHTHTDSCYETVLICGFATPETASGEHEHTDACYERQLVCTIPEHTHTPDCYSDAEADTEGESDWTQSFPQEALTGDWAQDTVTIAASQIGYTESTKNWQLNDDGTRRGYTRYGAWYGNPYGSWNGMFAAFCLHYAGVEDDFLTTANAAGVNAWTVALYQAGELQGPGHEAVPGDVVFLGSDDTIESCGIVADVYEADGVQTLTVIAGDVDNTVSELTIPADSDSVLGYAATAEAYAAYREANPDTQPDEDPNTPDDGITADTATTLETTDETTASVVQAATADGIDLSGSYAVGDDKTDEYIQSVTADSAKYGDGQFETTFNMKLRIPTAELKQTVTEDGYGHAYYELPDNIQLTSQLLNGQWRSSNTDGVEYRFVTVNGKNRIELRMAKAYLDKASTYVNVASLAFAAKAGITSQTDGGNLIFKFTDKKSCEIPIERVTYPDGNDTLNYDIDTTKKGEFDKDTNTLIYTVTITTTKGTPTPISVTDALTKPAGSTVENCEIVSITKNENGKTTPLTAEESKFTAGSDNQSFTMELPGLAKPTGTTTENSYTIVYKYKLDLPASINKTAENKFSASAAKNTEKIKDTASAKVTVKKETITKKGTSETPDELNKETPTLHWTVTVNDSHANITDKTLTDTLFDAGEVDEANLKITGWDENGKLLTADQLAGTYTVNTKNGKVESITFNKDSEDGTNRIKYQVDYTTTYEAGLNTTVKNTASFDGADASASVTGKVNEGASVVKKVGLQGPVNVYPDPENPTKWKLTVPWTVAITPPKSGIIPKGTLFSEVISSESANHYMTLAQAAAYMAAINKTVLGGNYENVKYYTADNLSKGYSVEKFPSGKNVGRITFELKQNVDVGAGNTITLQYDTTYQPDKTFKNDANDAKKPEVVNYLKMGDVMGRDTLQTVKVTVEKGALDKSEFERNDDNKDDTFAWYVKVGCTWEKTEQRYTITDKLPQEVELVRIGIGTTKDKTRYEKGETQCWEPDGNGGLTQVSGYPTSSTSLANHLKVTAASIDENNVVTLDITKGTGYEGQTHFFLIYECRLKSSTWDAAKDGTTVNLKNDVVVSSGGNDVEYIKTITAKIKKDPTPDPTPTEEPRVSKYGEWDGFQNSQTYGRLHYSVDINPEGKHLLEGTDNKSLTLVDTLTNNSTDHSTADLLTETVKVYRAKLGEDGKVLRDENGKLIAEDTALEQGQWTFDSYDPDTHEFQLTLPDGVPLVLKYDYLIQYTGEANKNETIKLGNEVSLNGYTAKSDDQKLPWEKSNTSMKLENAYSFTKVDVKSYSRGLEGAVFRLYRYNGTEFEPDPEDITYVTDANGQFSITETYGKFIYTPNTAYMVKEVAAPGVYILPDNPPEYYFYFSSKDLKKYPSNMPSDFPATAVDLTTQAQSVIVTNTQLNTDLSIRKVWAENTPDEQKTPVTIKVKRLIVPLTEWEAYYDSEKSDAEWPTWAAQQLEALKAQYQDTSWETSVSVSAGAPATLHALPLVAAKADGNTPEKRYIYYVEEDVPAGFRAEVSIAATRGAGTETEPLTNYTFTVTNTPTTTYELPETGGRGTMPYMAGGAALMAVSLLCGYIQKRKRERRQND